MRGRYLFALLLCAGASFYTSSAVAAEKPTAEHPVVQEAAVRYYLMKHDVSKDEALRRIELQDAVMPSMGELKSALGDRYGGAWFDADDGGQLKVAVVNRDSAGAQAALDDVRTLLRSKDALATTAFVDADTSYDDLVKASSKVAKELAGIPGAGTAVVGVDVENGSVAITRSVGLTEPEREARLDVARQTTDVPVREKTVDKAVVPELRCASGNPFCDRPLRGGVEMESYSHHCTAGFNVTSRSDGKRYVMTAGHCKTNAEWYTKHDIYGQWREIGPEHNMQFYWTGRDAGIIRAKTPSYWQQSPFPGPTIWIDDIPGVHQQNNNYYIGSEGTGLPGQIVCATGGGGYGRYPYDSERRMFWHGTSVQSYTWCGGVTVASETVHFGGVDQNGNPLDPSMTVYNEVRTDLCFWPGMSGGPVFKWNVAYGMISGDACQSGFQWGWFYPAILAENDLNVNIVH